MTTHESGLLTDLYELTMAAAYHAHGLRSRATFELYIRSLPANRSYLISAGLEQALDFLQGLRFTHEELTYLRELEPFRHVDPSFFDVLGKLTFSGEVWAIPEGSAVFPNEPLVRVNAPILEAQIVETYLLSAVTFQTAVASKASRVLDAADGRSVVDFGSRRAHGPEAGVLAARAAYIGGCSGTSNVEAGRRFGIPVFGTMAHSFVMAFEDEMEAFERFLDVFPDSATLLVDTYDTLNAVRQIAERIGDRVQAIRLDSGDLVDLSIRSRRILDEGGMFGTRIFASGDLDEYRIADLLNQGARLDAFGVGTKLVTSSDAPSLNGVYKLVSLEEDGIPEGRIKLSSKKLLYPFAKQVWRSRNPDGFYSGDVIAGADEPSRPGAEPLLRPVMREGRRTGEPEDLGSIRERVRGERERLPLPLRDREGKEHYPVAFSDHLEKERKRIEDELVGE